MAEPEFNVKLNQVVISNDSATWLVPEDMVKCVDNLKFIKLQPSRNIMLNKLVCGKSAGPNSSLSGTPGYNKLQVLRNTMTEPTDADAASKLFDDSEADAKHKKKKRLRRAASADLKENPKFMDLQIEGINVKTLVAVHPTEAVWIEASPIAINAVFTFLRAEGIDKPPAEAKDVKHFGKHVVKQGKGRLAERLEDGRLKYIKS